MSDVSWIGVEEDFEPEMPTKNEEGDFGFIYLISVVDPKTNKTLKYIGCKQFWKVVKYPPLKGRINKRHITKPSDWKTYNSSSPKLQQLIKDGAEHTKEIVYITSSKWETNYVENKMIFITDAVMRDDYLNQVVNLRQGNPPKKLKEKFDKDLTMFDFSSYLSRV